MASIYKIFFKNKPEVFYIGSAIDFNLRKIRHTHQLKKGIHKNKHLQRTYYKYGHDNLEFVIIEELKNNSLLIKREQFFIDLLKPQLNILKIAGSLLGYKHSEDTKKHIGKINSGRKMTPEQVSRGVLSRTGQKTSLGCKRTEKMKRHLSLLKMKKVRCLKTGFIFNSIGEAAKYLNLKYSTFYAKISNRHFNDTNMEII